MRKLTMAGFLVLVACALNVSATAPQTAVTALHAVQKIYVEHMGISPEAARFRLLLEDQLSAKGFSVVAKRDEADAVLFGVVSLVRPGIFGGPADINVTARLTSSNGDRLWSVNTGGQIVILNPVSSLKFKEPLEYRAKELANKLSHAREQSAKAAGLKVTK
ncbi:MAG TPA: hypothetical protein VGW58_19850 [Pyrinomonadaceae bacterium]|nr:hypothetical protein [Pyrinomonadaceae bacterium]